MATPKTTPQERAALEAVVGLAADKAARRRRERPDGFPFVTEGGRWIDQPDGGWTGGFWVGTLLHLWRVTGDDALLRDAERAMERLLPRLHTGRADKDWGVDFDLGFLFRHSFALAADLTGDDSYRQVALQAADRLVGLAHPVIGMLVHTYPERVRRFGPSAGHSSIIDALMNLELLWWGGGEAQLRVARRHLARSLETLLRPDGSVIALVDLDPDTGAVIRQGAAHGRAPESEWTRGVAWAIQGCRAAASASGDPDAQAAGDALLERWDARTWDDGVPPWDFADPDGPRDSSAAAIVAASAPGRSIGGLLGRLLPPGVDGLLGDGCYSLPQGRGVGGATVWGDHYLLLAALDRLALAASFFR